MTRYWGRHDRSMRHRSRNFVSQRLSRAGKDLFFSWRRDILLQAVAGHGYTLLATCCLLDSTRSIHVSALILDAIGARSMIDTVTLDSPHKR